MFKNRYLKYFGTMIGYILMLSSLCPEISANAVYFETNSTGSLTLGNAYWEAAFDKTKGSLEYIIDKSTGGIVCHGSKDKSLWAVNFFNDPDVYKSEVNSFSYTWDQNAGILKFYYSSKNPSGKAIDAEVTIRASEERWFEMQLHLTNKYGSLARFAHFPYNLAFSTTEIEEALYPILPGVIFQKSFFLEGRSYTGNYPGWPGVFADFVSLKTTNGDLSIYAYQPLDKFIPSLLGFIADSEDTGKFYYYHPFGAGVKNNEEYSSPWVKFRVGDGNYIDQIEAYRVDNGFDKFSDIQLKLGGDYEKIVSAPILKIEATKLKLKFSEYDDYIFKLLPSPLIYHFCGYQKGGFDQNVPDLLPPEPAWGTTEELAAMIARLHQRGDLFMPYTNPTWWDDESATLLNLPSLYTIAQVAVLHENYLPVYETYNYYYGGYVICPYSKFAIDILSTKMEENKELLQSDIIFEDQIGARQWWFDFNESSPTNLSYENGWIEHTRKYKDRLLATELGYDRLAETEIGFYGSVLLPIREGVAGSLWGAANWKIYPMISILLRDKVLLYQHDLADYTMTSFKENFSWNLAFGYLPTMQIVNLASLNPEWVRMISDFTKYLFSKYAGERIRRYSSESEYVSCTEFDTFTVYTNWNESYPFDIEGHSIAPMGAMIKKNDGSITAGVYTSYNGISLEGKEHYLIEERSADSIILRHYLGGGTKIAVQLPQEWNSTQRFKILMYLSKDGIYIVKSYQVENGKIIFKLFEGNEDLYVESYKILRDTSSN